MSGVFSNEKNAFICLLSVNRQEGFFNLTQSVIQEQITP